MKIVLINPPFISLSGDMHMALPLGLAYLASFVESHGHTVEIIDAPMAAPSKKLEEKKYWIGLSYDEILEQINQIEPDVVGISCPFSLRYQFTIELSQKIKKRFPEIVMIAGGVHPTLFPEKTLSEGQMDFVVLGEGESTLLELLDGLQQSKQNFNYVDGLCYRDETGRIVKQPKTKFIKAMDTLPFPAREKFDLRQYFARQKNGRWDLTAHKQTPIITSRSCPNFCTFCCTYQTHGRGWRPRSPENVVAEMEHCYHHFGIKSFSFEDDNLTANKKRMLNLCRLIQESPIDFKWNTPHGVSVKTLDKQVLQAMKNSGCVSINLAIESGDERILNEVMKKNLSLDKVKKVARICEEIGLTTNAYFIVGMPGETRESLENSYNFARQLKLKRIEVYYATPFPGTELYDFCLENDYLDLDMYQQSHNSWSMMPFYRNFIKHNEISQEELANWRTRIMNLSLDKR